MASRFSINSIALGNIRRRRGSYLLLIAGIVLAVYFVAAALFFADTMFTSLREQHYNRLGEQDAIVFDCGDRPLTGLISGNVFSNYGVAEILGYVLPEGEDSTGASNGLAGPVGPNRRENGFSIARFDDTALALARKEPLEGRLPEKAGEIALERSALARLRSQAGIGESITLTLLVPDGSGFLEAPVRKSYTLVGILTDKLIYLSRWNTVYPAYRDYPAAVLSMDEQIEPGGRAVTNCYGRYAGEAAASFERLKAFSLKEGADEGSWWLKVEQTSYRLFAGNFGADDNPVMHTSIFFTIIALVLVCAACLGIIGAFSADLESRRRQIGLFRAVGATRGQIRAIYGRETILLALCAIPLALALAGLTVWGITAALGESYTFRPNAFIMLVIAAAGLICVRLAAAIPLRKAARIPPMQALRDLELTRRLKRSRLASRLHFDVPRHTARRSSILYKNRQLGTTAMLAVSIVLLSLAAFGAKPLLSEASYDYGCDYMLINQSRMTDWLMEYGLHRPGITEQDRADAAALKGVKAVSGTKVLSVKLLPERITPYISNHRYSRFDYLSPEPPYGDDHPETGLWRQRQHQDYLASKAKYGYLLDYLTVDCGGIEMQAWARLDSLVSAGRINPDKLNAGEEILLIAPSKYGLLHEDLGRSGLSTHIDYELDAGTAYDAVYQNDMFQAGDSITLSLLYSDNPGEHPDGPQLYNEDGSRILPDDALRIDRRVTIGAVLEPEISGKSLSAQLPGYFHCAMGNILTTGAGLNALGFDPPYDVLEVTLSESPDTAMEQYLETNLAAIAARTAGAELESHVALVRENREMVYGLLIAAGAVLLLCFAICAGMINNALSARIRAGRRQIGTLRAVGASERTITRSYRWQLLSAFAWGTITGLAVGLTLCGGLLWKGIVGDDALSLFLWPPLLFVTLLFGICLLNINLKVSAIFRSSIVENIREL